MAQRPAHILIADDDVQIRRLVRRILLPNGHYELFMADNGADALQLFRKQRENGAGVDLVISDINMPVMSGIELHRRLVKDEHFPSFRIILMSGGLYDFAQEEYIRRQHVRYIKKSDLFEELPNRVQRALSAPRDITS